jgi:hypothetical protein
MKRKVYPLVHKNKGKWGRTRVVSKNLSRYGLSRLLKIESKRIREGGKVKLFIEKGVDLVRHG